MARPRPPAGVIVPTRDDYPRLPHDGRRYDLRGEGLQVAPVRSPRHQNICRRLARFLEQHVRA